MEGILVAVPDNSVPSISSPVEPSWDMVLVGKDRDELSFALISPLSTQHHS